MGEIRTKEWGSRPLEFNVAGALPLLEAGMHVRLIASSPFRDCNPQQEVAAVLKDKDLCDFDHIPVREDKHIIGVFNSREKHGDKRHIRDAMQPLREANLLSADAPLISFVEKADTRPFCLVLEGEKFTGIVTLSDLQKLPVWPALFLLVTHLELLLVRWMRNLEKATWQNALDAKSRKELKERCEGLRRNQLFIDAESATTLGVKIKVAVALNLFPAEMNAAAELNEIRQLRNAVAHSSDFGSFPDEAKKLPGRVRLARKYIGQMGEQPISAGGTQRQ